MLSVTIEVTRILKIKYFQMSFLSSSLCFALEVITFLFGSNTRSSHMTFNDSHIFLKSICSENQ